MTFSKNIKNELAKNKISKNTENVKCEFLGYIVTNISVISPTLIQFTNESVDILERYRYILKKICNIECLIIKSNNDLYINKSLFEINIYNEDIEILCKCLNLSVKDMISQEYNWNIIKNVNEEYLISYIRGMFLGGGYLSNPQGTYHLEIYLENIRIYELLLDIFSKYDIHTNLANKKNKNVIYITDGESIANFLALIGANIGVINFEQTRVMKYINNNINRAINCETANLNKILDASKKQIQDIEYLKDKGKYESLSSVLKDTCDVRINNSEQSLEEIANILGISKSGLNNRFKKLHKIAKEIREKEENNEEI